MLKNQAKLNLFEAQKRVLDSILSDYTSKNYAINNTLEWKIIIVDDSNMLTLQTLYTVKDLR